MPSSDERRKGLRARLPLEFFFNVLGASEEYTRGQVSIVKRLAAIDAIRISAPKTEAQALLTRIDQKLSLLVGLMADRFTHKNYLHQAVVHDISEFGLAFGHTL
ncbi:MAG: hypothetical protein LBS31_06405, partial [Candidatus Adiutrix sp.]|nr:hypothetical protein [Candidatus Adiutrix sp.]